MIFKLHIAQKITFLLVGLLLLFFTITSSLFAAQTSEFQITINPGTLSVDIVDGSFVTVANPSVAFVDASFSFSCGSTTGTLGSSTQQIYVQNTDSADNGWVVSIAASGSGDLWISSSSPSTRFDFNDSTSSGCTDGGDSDAFGGQMTINAASGTVATSTCVACDLTGISLGSENSFEEGVTDSITILSGSAPSDDTGDWHVRGVSLNQTLPGETPAYSDYAIDMTLSIVAS